MVKLFFTVLMFILPAPASAASTDTVLAPAPVSQPRGNPITIFGNPAVIKNQQKENPAGLRQEVPAEFKKAEGPKPVKKKKKRLPAQPEKKKPTKKPPKRKLVPVSFYDRWEPYRTSDCQWVLGKIFEPVYDFGPVRGLDLTWKPEPPPKPLRIMYRRRQ
ncbi:MAG: hypothetical protein KKH28_10210 [Elusimicrobia bacterium]|nr:hypothetical protein [Elusimicrobiota bacterium]